MTPENVPELKLRATALSGWLPFLLPLVPRTAVVEPASARVAPGASAIDAAREVERDQLDRPQAA
jgi:hypothetical protein